MTNFLAELWSKRTHKTGLLFVPVFVVCFFVALMFASLICLLDWMLQWTWRRAIKTGDVLLNLVFTAFGLYVFFGALPLGDLITILAGLGAFSVWTWTTIRALSEWRSG